MIIATRYHDFSMGHRVVGHESKCAHLHGHNYRVTFYVEAPLLDPLGRVVDFSVIKSHLCMWLEDEWDHKMVLWDEDPLVPHLQPLVPADIVTVPFNPTAENIAQYLVNTVAPRALDDLPCELIRCRVEETRKCGAEYAL